MKSLAAFHNFALSFSILAYCPTTLALEPPLGELPLFIRCYQHLTQKFPLASDPRRMAVAAGTLTAAQACMQVLDTAQLQPNGYISGHSGPIPNLSTQTNPPNPEGLAVLRTLNDFHRSWFPIDNFSDAVTEPEEAIPASRKVHDEAEAASHVTRALFAPTTDFSTIVTGTQPVEALRSDGQAMAPLMKTSASATSSTIQDWLIEQPFSGVLQGVRLMPTTRSSRVGYSVEFPSVINVNQSEGGGIIGLKSYLLATLGQFKSINFLIQPMDGGLINPRRWSKSIYHDLLCRDLPVIRLSDASASPFVVSNPNSATPPFRKGASCMQCHASMDQMAGTARNMEYVGIPHWRMYSVFSLHVGKRTPTSPAPPREAEPLGMYNGSSSSWSSSAPWGRLYFRSYDGTLVNQEVNGIAALGAALAQQKDLYVCAASRYFQFFTGVGVDLRDEGDPSQPTLSAGERAYRQIVIDLGLRLQQSRSLRLLIQDIISSPTYRRSSMRESQ